LRKEDIGMTKAISKTALASAAVLLALAGCGATPTKESTGELIDDAAITTKVKTAILADPALKVMQINVETFKGTVQLSGFVSSPQDVIDAQQVAAGVDGVKLVRNDLVVR
jgi:osmotically-inducible protein OsmY